MLTKQFLLTRTILLAFLTFLILSPAHAQLPSTHQITYTTADSISIESMLRAAPRHAESAEYMLLFSTLFMNRPYVAGTLNLADNEKLTINTRELDCTTFLENVVALTLCAQKGLSTFHDFCEKLRLIRYADGHIAYHTRLHYFTSWIENAMKHGITSEHYTPGTTCTQHINVCYMSTHPNLYRPLRNNAMNQKLIKQAEQDLEGKTAQYIPTHHLKNQKILKDNIHDGDIIAIVTSRRGLDIAHIGIATWHKDGTLHLINASQIHKHVTDEPMTLYEYMKKHPNHRGVRVLRMKN